MRRRKAFTLIELLIVVAIIAILAAIAVPNFLEAQVRSKIARCRADMRTLMIAAESYRIDNNKYMPDNVPGKPDVYSWCVLSTPIAYISSVPLSPFKETYNGNWQMGLWHYFGYWYGAWTGGVQVPNAGQNESGVYWRGTSAGPDNVNSFQDGTAAFSPLDIRNRTPKFVNAIYDATNGTTSRGDIYISNAGFM
jgi:prepilin-type N-terminal cleavage/methylation domain-containing protein